MSFKTTFHDADINRCN